MAFPTPLRSGAAAALAAALSLSAGRPCRAANIAAAVPRAGLGTPGFLGVTRAFHPEPILRLSPAEAQPLARLGRLAQTPVGRELGLESYSFLAQFDPARSPADRLADAPMLSPVAQAWSSRDIREGVEEALRRFEDMPVEEVRRLLADRGRREQVAMLLNAIGALRSESSRVMGLGLEELQGGLSSVPKGEAALRSRQEDLRGLEGFLGAVEAHPFYSGASFSHAPRIAAAREKAAKLGEKLRDALAGVRDVSAGPGAVATGRAGAPKHMAGLKKPVPAAEAFEGIAQSPEMAQTLKVIDLYAPEDYTVLIQGETGAGKELVAAALHYSGPRAGKGAFIRFNAPNLSATLIESELFGHEKGAFTDATERRIGLLEAANGGTVLIDEIGDLPLDLQAKLLRFLQEGTIRRVGGNENVRLDVRVLAATHVDLEKAVAEGRFLPDLYHRLNVLPLKVPALRERVSDVEPIARHFWSRFAPERPFEEAFSGEVLDALRAHAWPGNVRELRNAVERAAVLSKLSGRVEAAHLFPRVEASAVPLGHGVFARSKAELESIWDRLQEDVVRRAVQGVGAAAARIAEKIGMDRKQVSGVLARLGLSQARLEEPVKPAAAFDGVAASPQMARMLEAVGLVAPHDTTVLITGETGTGKELVARAIVQNGSRADKPFISFNGTDLTETLIESELFGHEKGAFTGASARRVGLLEAADGGTVFIDEVGRLSPGLQAKLLRFLESGTIRRVGANQDIALDVRVVAATNIDLEGLVREGRFREDLYHRLNVFPVASPPLRDRTADILPLAGFFWDQAEAGRPGARGFDDAFSDAARNALLSHAWPGNVRELQSAIRRAAVLSRAAPDRRVSVANLFPDGSYRPQPATIEAAKEVLRGIRAETYRRAVETHGSVSAAAKALGVSQKTLIGWGGRAEE